MTHSQACTNLIKEFEGFRAAAYRDGNGVWTIGYGYTGPEVKAGLVWSESKALQKLNDKITEFEGYVNKLVKVALSQGQFDSLVSFVYNFGPTKFKTSTLLKRLNQRNYQAAADQFMLWVQKGSVNEAGLTRRRAAEKAMFLGE